MNKKDILARLTALITYLPWQSVKYLVLSDEEYDIVTGLDPHDPCPSQVYTLGSSMYLQSRYQDNFREAVEKEVAKRIGATDDN